MQASQEARNKKKSSHTVGETETVKRRETVTER